MPVLVSSESPALLLRVPDVAALLELHPRLIYRWVDAGVFPESVLIRAGRAVYFRRAALESWLKGARDPMPPNAESPLVIDVATAAKMLGRTRRELYSWLVRGGIPSDVFFRSGRSWWFLRASGRSCTHSTGRCENMRGQIVQRCRWEEARP